MNAKSSRAKIAVVSAVGVALALPLFLNPASAVTDGSHFFVHAQDQTNPKPHEALAGLGGLKSGDGSTGTPGGDDTSTALATYTAGPLSFKVTQSMLDFSAANVKAQEEGRTGDIKTDPSGWQTIWFYDNDSGDATQSMPAANSSNIDMILSKGSTKPSGDSLYNPVTDDMVLQYNSGSMTDGRVTPKVDNLYFYKKEGGSGGGSVTNGRYTSQDGKLIATKVQTLSSGGYNVNRYVSPTNLAPVASDTEPYRLSTDNGSTNMAIRLKTTTDGYNYIELSQGADGSLNLRFEDFTGLDSYGNAQADYALRKNGPVYLDLNSEGKITAFSYFDSNGDRQSGGDGESTYTVADYNSMTGQNWNGDYPKLSDFDTSKPFTPQG